MPLNIFMDFPRDFLTISGLTMTWLLRSKLFNILKLVATVIRVTPFQHSRNGYHGYSNYIISTF